MFSYPFYSLCSPNFPDMPVSSINIAIYKNFIGFFDFKGTLWLGQWNMFSFHLLYEREPGVAQDDL